MHPCHKHEAEILGGRATTQLPLNTQIRCDSESLELSVDLDHPTTSQAAVHSLRFASPPFLSLLNSDTIPQYLQQIFMKCNTHHACHSERSTHHELPSSLSVWMRTPIQRMTMRTQHRRRRRQYWGILSTWRRSRQLTNRGWRSLDWLLMGILTAYSSQRRNVAVEGNARPRSALEP
jgi:hypothetical protein